MQEIPPFVTLADISIEDLTGMDKEKQLGLLNNTTVEDVSSFPEDKKNALMAKLRRMQAMNEKEPAWDRENHWPLLEALQGKTGNGYIPVKDRPRRRF